MTSRLKAMRVLQVVPDLDTGGVEQTTLDMAQAIISAGGQAFVVAKGGRLVKILNRMGATVITLPVHSKNPLVQFANFFRIKRLIGDLGINLVHVRSRAPALAALKAARALNIPTVATYAGIYNARSRLKRAYNGVMTRADRVIANSDFTKAHIMGTYKGLDPARIVSIPRGIDPDKFNPETVSETRKADLAQDWGLAPGDSRTRFLLAGRLTRWKGQMLIIKAAEALRAMGRDDFLILMAGGDQGRQNYRKALNAAISAAGLEAHIRLVGLCTDMAAAYGLCRFALAPSIEPEAFGRTAVEPQLMGVLPMAADHGASSETIIEGVTGWRVPPGDSQAWALAMKHALELSAGDFATMSMAARSHAASRFSLSAMCNATLNVYLELINPR